MSETFQSLFSFSRLERHALEVLAASRTPPFLFEDGDAAVVAFAHGVYADVWAHLGNALVDGPAIIRELSRSWRPPAGLVHESTLARFQVKWQRAFLQTLAPLRGSVSEAALRDWVQSIAGAVAIEALRILGAGQTGHLDGVLTFFRAERWGERLEVWDGGKFREGYRFSEPDGRWETVDVGVLEPVDTAVRVQHGGATVLFDAGEEHREAVKPFLERWVKGASPVSETRPRLDGARFYRDLLEKPDRHAVFQWLVRALPEMLGLSRAALFQALADAEAFKGVYAYRLPPDRVRRVIEDRSRFFQLLERGTAALRIVSAADVIAERYVKEFGLGSLLVVPISDGGRVEAILLLDDEGRELQIAPQTLAEIRSLVDGVGRRLRDLEPRTLSDVSQIMTSLTAREREVLLHLVEGATNQDIAGALGVSPYTLREHVSHILAKTGLHSRTEVVAHYFRHPT